MFGMQKTLIVVYKDEMLMNQLKKLVETNDDSEDGAPVGTTDDSINIVSWTEKVWNGNKKAGNIKGKILFLGDIKGTDKLTPVVDIKFDKYGVKFGWAGNQAILFIDPSVLDSKELYQKFLDELKSLPVPDMIKATKVKFATDEPEEDSSSMTEAPSDDVEIPEVVEVPDVTEEKKKIKLPGFLKKAKDSLEDGAEAAAKFGSDTADKAELLLNKKHIQSQMMFYGVVKLYLEGLEAFMNI